MEKEQTIIITLDEYKELRTICEEYCKLLGEYKLLSLYYNDLVEQIQPTETKQKQKIGFRQNEE